MRDVRPTRPSGGQAAIWRGGRRFFAWLYARRLDLVVEGRDHLPTSGPVILAARHYHHFWDGAALIGTIDRPVHIVVGLDWLKQRPLRRLMEALCGVTQFPVILRTDRVEHPSPEFTAEARRYLRRATEETVGLLRGGGIVLVFPEAYPTVDPNPTPKHGPDGFLPFHPGFVQFAQLAEADGSTRVPIVPVGFHYARLAGRRPRWRVTMRFGSPLRIDEAMDRAALVAQTEERVRTLSAPPM